jgi:hypothetical protein
LLPVRTAQFQLVVDHDEEFPLCMAVIERGHPTVRVYGISFTPEEAAALMVGMTLAVQWIAEQ